MNARSASQAIRALRVRSLYIETHPLPVSNHYIQPIAVRPAVIPAIRGYATSTEADLKTTFKEVLPAKRELLKKVKGLSGKVIGEVKIENTIGGMRYV